MTATQVAELLGNSRSNAFVRQVLTACCSRFATDAEVLHVSGAPDLPLGRDRCPGFDLVATNSTVMPDIVLFWPGAEKLILCDIADRNGPITAERRESLWNMFHHLDAEPRFMSAFRNRKSLAKHFPDIAWETVVWAADTPDHLIYLDGGRLFGPYR